MLTLCFGLPVAAPSAIAGPQPTEVLRRGVPSPGVPLPQAAPLPLLQGFGELGYVEAQNVAIEARYAEGKVERLPDLAAALVRAKVDIIVTWSTPAALAAKSATDSIPIVMARGGDAVGAGLVQSLARPGGNITGMSFLGPELVAKRLELLKEAAPAISRVAVLWNSGNPHEVLLFNAAQVAAQGLCVALQGTEARSPNQIEEAFESMSRARSNGLLVFENLLILAHRKLIAELAARLQLPAKYGMKEFVAAGGLLAYGPNGPAMERRAATYVDKILKGAKPADLPIEQPTKFELVINLKTAMALGLTIPQSVFIRADEVIQ